MININEALGALPPNASYPSSTHDQDTAIVLYANLCDPWKTPENDVWVKIFRIHFHFVISESKDWAIPCEAFDPTVELVNNLDIPRIDFDKGLVYMDDDLEAERNCLITLHLMKHIMIFVFSETRVKTDLTHGPHLIQARYLG